MTATFANDFLLHILENADIALVGDAAGLLGSATAGNLYISLHTANPAAGNQTTSEAAYTSYARVAVARTAGAWTTAGGASENTNDVVFPQATGGSETITHVGIGTASSGNGKLLMSVALDSSLAVSNGITPQFLAGELDFTAS